MLTTVNGSAVWMLEAVGPRLGSSASAIDLIGETYGSGTDIVAVPVERLDPAFFRLASGLAGEFIQKLQNYGFRLAVIGDISDIVKASKPLHDFVYETNKRGYHLFVADEAELARRLAES